MTDWTAVGLRLATYMDFALLFGVPLQLLRQRALPSRGVGRLLAALAAIGLVLALLSLLSLSASMAGTDLFALDGETLRMVALETAPGTAFLVRLGALAVALAAAFLPDGRRLVILAAGVALATVTWTGHGGMDEGARGWVHVAANIAHLLAAAAWVGAIATLLAGVAGLREAEDRRVDAVAALAGFSGLGTLLVGVLIVTGAVNGALLLGWEGLRTLPATLYGVLLLAKLALFGVMLLLAAANRWWLAPRLAGGEAASARALRISLAFELTVATIILGLVAWLGTLSPLP